MSELEALELAKMAARRAMDEVGDDKDQVFRKLQEMVEADPVLAEAFKTSGLLLVASDQAQKH